MAASGHFRMTHPHDHSPPLSESSPPPSSRIERLVASRPFQFLFLLWLLLVNVLYYAQYRDLVAARWPSIRSLWPW